MYWIMQYNIMDCSGIYPSCSRTKIVCFFVMKSFVYQLLGYPVMHYSEIGYTAEIVKELQFFLAVKAALLKLNFLMWSLHHIASHLEYLEFLFGS